MTPHKPKKLLETVEEYKKVVHQGDFGKATIIALDLAIMTRELKESRGS